MSNGDKGYSITCHCGTQLPKLDVFSALACPKCKCLVFLDIEKSKECSAEKVKKSEPNKPVLDRIPTVYENPYDVAVGQRWEENDPRVDRVIEVLSLEPSGHAIVKNVNTGKKSKIALKSFRSGSRGYTKISDRIITNHIMSVD